MALQNLSALVGYYLPTSHVVGKKKVMFEVLLKLLSNEHIDPQTKIPIVDNLFGFLSDLDHLKLAELWLENGIVFSDPATKAELFKLG